MLYFNYFTNPCQPDKGRISCIFEQPKTVWQIIKEQKVDLTMPILCLINGVPVLRKDWSNVFDDGELISIISLPLGGGGGKSSNPVQVVLTVAVIVASVYTGGVVGAAYGAVWGAAAAAAVSIGGGILVNTLVPTPKPALNGMTSSSYTQSPTYSLQAQGNQARLGNPIPVIYGRHLIYPDFAAQPYYRYQNNVQYVYQLHCIGQGNYNVEQIRIEDTPIGSFKEIYSTMPVGKIVGEFKFKKIHIDSPKVIWNKTKQSSGISEKFFFDYFEGKSEAYAIEIEEVTKYKVPLDPHAIFPKFTAPQSFCYMK